MRHIRLICRPALLVLVCLIAWGCSREQPIRSYTAIKDETTPPPPAAPAPTASAATTGAITWTLPEGWSQVGANTDMRYATLTTSNGAAGVEVSIVRLPGAAGGVEQNVSRWADQVGFKPDPANPVRIVEQRRCQSGDYLAVDITGGKLDEATGQPMRVMGAVMHDASASWFFKAIGPADALAPHKASFLKLADSVAFGSLPPGHPSVANPHAAGAAAASTPASPTALPPSHPPINANGPTWTLPNGWQAGPQTQFAVATFLTQGDDGATRTTISRLRHPAPAGQFDANNWRLANINRWRAQVGLTAAPALDQAGVEAVTVDQMPGDMVDVAGDADIEGSVRILGVVVQKDDASWFIKMTGPHAAVAAQKPSFRAFVDSFRFHAAAKEAAAPTP